MSASVVVLDYGSGNVRSACRALDKVGARVTLSDDLNQALACDGLVVPGVGAFAAVADALRRLGAADVICERHDAQRPQLGICVGMQVLFERGFEGGTTSAGLGLLPGDVVALRAPIVPHMGWSDVRPHPDSTLLSGVGRERMYFVHSYAVTTDANAEGVRSSWAHHGEDFVAAIEYGATSATQFHPEKSGSAGQRVLANWLATL